MIGLYIFLGTIIFVTFFLMFYFIFRSASHKNTDYIDSTNKEAEEKFIEKKFDYDKKIYITDNNTHDYKNEYKKFIAINTRKKLIGLIDYEEGNILIVKFNEILNYQVYGNDVKSNFGGHIGWGWGTFGSRQEQNYTDLKVIIRLKNAQKQQISYTFIEDTFFNMGVSNGSRIYQKCMSSMQELVSFLEYVMAVNKENIQKKKKDMN